MTTTLTNNSNPLVNDVAGLRTGRTLTTTTTTPPTQPSPSIPLPWPEPEPELTARTLDQFVRATTNDPGELLKHRYLCRGGGLLLVGQTGLGKSSLAMQLMIKWALGQPVFGLEPARAIKSLLIQAENDDGDLAEMKEGVFNGLGLSEEEQAEASQNIRVIQESTHTGPDLFSKVIIPLLTKHRPDLLWIDPALSYLGGDMNNQKDVGSFLRNQLGPVLVKHNCGAVVIHHTNKITNNPDKSITDPAYLGAGSAEWANWSRAVLALRKTDVANLYELVCGKRGEKLKWRAADGQALTFTKYIGHSKRPDTICWMEMAIAEAEELKAGNGKTIEDVLKFVPQTGLIAKDDLIKTCRQSGIGRNTLIDLISDLMDDDQLFEHLATRAGKRPKVLFSRQPNARTNPLPLDCYVQDSEGHYLEQIVPPSQPKTL